MGLFHKESDKNYDRLVAENNFISDIQLAVEKAMAAKQLSQADVAKMLDISPARMSQILSDNGANLEARTIARIAHALRMVALVEFVDQGSSGHQTVVQHSALPETIKGWVKADKMIRESVWPSPHANDDCLTEAA